MWAETQGKGGGYQNRLSHDHSLPVFVESAPCLDILLGPGKTIVKLDHILSDKVFVFNL